MLIIRPSFWSSYGKIFAEPHYEATDNQFTKYCHTPRNHRFQQVFWCWSSKRIFWALTVKFALNPIVAQNMANLKHTVTGLLFTVFRYFLCAYHVSNILESLQWNSYLKKLRLIRWPVWKILSHASESSFSATLIVLTIRTTLKSSCREIVKDGQFIKHCHTPLNHRFQLHLWCLPSERHFETLTVKLSLNAITTQKIADFQNSVTWYRIIVFI